MHPCACPPKASPASRWGWWCLVDAEQASQRRVLRLIKVPALHLDALVHIKVDLNGAKIAHLNSS